MLLTWWVSGISVVRFLCLPVLPSLSFSTLWSFLPSRNEADCTKADGKTVLSAEIKSFKLLQNMVRESRYWVITSPPPSQCMYHSVASTQQHTSVWKSKFQQKGWSWSLGSSSSIVETTDFILGSYFRMLVQAGVNGLLETKFLLASALVCTLISSSFEK